MPALEKQSLQLKERIQKAVVALTKRPGEEERTRLDFGRSIDLAEQLADQLRQFTCVCLDKSLKVQRQDFHRFSINIVTLIELLADCLPVALTRLNRHHDTRAVNQLEEKADSLLVSTGQIFLLSLELLLMAARDRHKLSERDSKQKKLVTLLISAFHHFVSRARQFQLMNKNGAILQVPLDDSFVLPVDIARGLISRKISFPPPYDELVQKTQLLRALTGQDLSVSDSSSSNAATLCYPSVDESQSSTIKPHKYLAKVSTLEIGSWFSSKPTWGKWVECMVEVYGDLLTVWLIQENNFSQSVPMIYKHLDLMKLVHVETDKVRYFEIEINPSKSIRLQIQNEKFRKEFEHLLDKLAASNV